MTTTGARGCTLVIFDSHWDKESINFRNILLDGDNPRIPSRFHGNHDAVFSFLLRNEDVIGLANSIIRTGGLYPSESIICLKENDNEYVVLEGNRRLSAVRILHDPELLRIAGVREAHLNKFDPSLLDRIKFLEASVVTSRATAKPIIAALHLSGGKHPWSDRRKVTFAATEARYGVGYSEISANLMCSEAQAMEYVCCGRILNSIQNLSWSKAEFDILDNDRFRLSAMFKALTTNLAQKYFGQPIFMKNGEINRQLPDYETIVKIIVSDSLFWQAGKEVLFSINENTSLSTYFRARFGTPDERDNTSDLFAQLPTAKPHPSPFREIISTGEPEPKWNRHEPSSFFEHIRYTGPDLRTQQLVRELSRLSSKSFENQTKGFEIFSLSASFLVRSILEWTIYVRIRDRGFKSDFEEFLKKGRPSLDHFLSFAVQKHKALGIPKDYAQKIEAVRNDAALKNDLQWNVHNDKGNWSSKRISEIAASVRPIIEYFLSSS